MKLVLGIVFVFALSIVGLTLNRFPDQGLNSFDENVAQQENGLSTIEESLYDINSLEFKLNDYFGESNRITPPVFDVEKFTDLSQYNALIELNILLNSAIDYGNSVSNFLDYGVQKKSNDLYELDVELYPDWLTLDSLLLYLTNENARNMVSLDLSRMGFTREELDTLFDYISENDFEKEALNAYLDYIDREYQLIGTMTLDRAGFTREFTRTSEQGARILAESYRDWALGLISQLTKEKQEVLIQYLLSTLSSREIKSSPLEQSVDLFIEEVSTGDARSAMRQSLTM